MMSITPKILDIAIYIVGELEGDGYLRRGLEDVAYNYGFSNGQITSVSLVEEALKLVQHCDPPGIGARNLKECLLLQLKRINKNNNSIITSTLEIIESKYNELTQHDVEKIEQDLKMDRSTMEKCLQLISKLSPKPFVETNKYELFRSQIVPEFEVSIEENSLFVSLTSQDPIRVRVNEEYVKIIIAKKNEKRKKQSINYFQSMISDAQMLVNVLRDRETTMINVMKVIVQMQPDFFRSGNLKDLKPMILQDVASKTGFDISAVSRITSNKHVQTPFGIFCLKNLFMRSVSHEDNGQMATTSLQVQELIQKIVNEENKNEPLSDSEIMNLLKTQGIHVARRTIVKYRELSGIPNSSTRKKQIGIAHV